MPVTASESMKFKNNIDIALYNEAELRENEQQLHMKMKISEEIKSGCTLKWRS